MLLAFTKDFKYTENGYDVVVINGGDVAEVPHPFDEIAIADFGAQEVTDEDVGDDGEKVTKPAKNKAATPPENKG